MQEERDSFVKNMPAYLYIRNSLSQAVEEALVKDWDLIALGCHEQAIAHRIAIYLERYFPLFHTDCEYNRCKHKAKEMKAEKGILRKKMRPDIIVHIRNSIHNVLAVELKANANNSKSNDFEKLKSLKSEAPYLYKATTFVRIHNGKDDIVNGNLRATISWYDVNEQGLAERIDEKVELESIVNSKYVKEAYQLRKYPKRPSPEDWPALKRLNEKKS